MNRRSKILQSSKTGIKKRRRLIIATLLFSFCVFLFITNIILILRLPVLQISSIRINSTYSSEIEPKILNILNGYYIYVIPKSNFLFYSKMLIEKTILDSFKNIDSLSIKRGGTTVLNVDIQEKIPESIVCEGFNGENKNEENCFYLDSSGYVFKKIKDASDDSYFHYYINSDLGDSLLGTSIIDEKKFLKLQDFVETVKRENLNPQGILIGLQGQYEMYSKNYDGSDLIIYFDDRAPIDKTISNFITFWDNSKITKKGATTTPVFESINLRFGNNIFYVTK